MPRLAIRPRDATAIGFLVALLWLSALASSLYAQPVSGTIALPSAAMSRPVAGVVSEGPTQSAAPLPERSPLVGLRPPVPLTQPQRQRLRLDRGIMQQWQSHLAPVSTAAAPAPPPTSPWQLGPQPAGAPPLSNPLLLTDGTVIAHVSCTGTWYKFTPDSSGSYVNGTWSPIASLPAGYTPRFFSSAVLPDGRVIVEGGEYNTGCNGEWTNLGAIYDPVANTWTSVTPPSGWSNIGDAQSIVLDNGTYLQSDCCHIAFQGGSPVAALLNATSLTWSSTGTGKADDYDEEGWTLLPIGNVLTVDAYTTPLHACGTGTEQYTPGTGAWTSAGNTPTQLPDCSNPSGNPSFEMGPQVLRPDGTVVAFGGTLCGDNAPIANCTNNTTTVTTHTAIFDSTNPTWSTGPDIPAVLTSGLMRNYSLADAPAALEPNGNILFAASPNYQGFVNPTHFFELSSGNTISQLASEPTDAGSFTAFQWNFLVLPTGQIMALETDGSNVWIYTPGGSPNAGWAPVIASVPSTLSAGVTYQISGSQFNGLSQGAAYGDDQQAATNFPLVRITNNATGHVFYARTFGASTTSVAPSTTVTTNFTVPPNIEAGASSLAVIANGIASQSAGVLAGTNAFDLVFQNSGNFALWQWQISGNQIVANGSLPLPPPNSGWQVIGTGDFNGDGQPDLVFQNNSSGALWLWEMNGTTIVGSLPLPIPNSGWKVVAVGDFNGDGHPDLVFQNSGTGALWLWEMNGASIIGSTPLPHPSAGWNVVGAADFDGDGFANDLVFQNNGTGALWLWEMNGTAISGSLPLPGPNADWNVAGVGTVNGAGHPDLVFQNNSSGALWLWEMNGTAIAANGSLPLPTPSTGWAVRAM